MQMEVIDITKFFGLSSNLPGYICISFHIGGYRDELYLHKVIY